MENMKITQLVVGPVATNFYIAENTKTKEALLIDPGAEAERIKAKVTELGVKPVMILLTHGHFDHAGAAGELAACYGIQIVAHEKERETLENPMINLSGMMGRGAVKYHADKYVKQGENFEAAGFPIQVLFTPGHTPGGCCYYIGREDVLFSGDSLFCGSVGRTDFPGGSMAQLVNGIKERVMTLPEQTLVLPGHDARTTVEEERMYNPYL